MSRKRRRPDRRRPFGSYAVRTPQAPPGSSADTPPTAPAGADALAHMAPHAADAMPVAEPDPVAPELPLDAVTSAGMRLRAAREGLGKTLDEIARESRIPLNVLSDIEHDRMDRLGAPVFARGYLRGYARSVGIPESVATAPLDAAADAPPPLVATQRTSRSRYLASRYAPPVAYALLTLVVLVPLLTSLGPALSPAPRLEPIDAPVAALAPTVPSAIAVPADTSAQAGQPVADAPAASPTEAPAGSANPIAEPAEAAPQQPMMASMAPMPEAVAATPIAQRVVLRLAQQSWVEITGVEGRRIEYSLLPAGSVREYQIAGKAEFRIGNSRGADLTVDGQHVDLAAHTRLNVARVEVGTDVDR